MVTPREALQGPSGGGLFSAPATTPVRGAAGEQVAALGGAMLSAGVNAYRLSERMQSDLDQAKIQDNSARYAELIANEEAAFNQLTGEDAHNAFEALQAKLHTSRVELEKNLTSNKQRQVFGRDSSMRQTVALNRMNAHRAGQIKNYRYGASVASFEQAKIDRVKAAVAGEAEQYVAQSVVMGRKLDDMAELMNLSPEARELARETAESTTNVSIIEGLIEKKALKRAGEFLEDNGDVIQDPKKVEALRTRIKLADVKQQADTLVDNVRTQGGVTAQRRFIRDMKNVDIEVRDELHRRVKAYAAEDQQNKSVRKADLLGQADELYQAGVPIPEELQTQLDEIGVGELSKSRGRNIPNVEGDYYMNTLTDKQLKLFDSKEALLASISVTLTRDQKSMVAAKWDRANAAQLAQQVAAANLTGKTRAASSYAQASEKSVVKLKQEQTVNAFLRNHYPDLWQVDFDDLTEAQVTQRLNIGQAVTMAANRIAQGAEHSELNNEVLLAAVKETLRVKSIVGVGWGGDEIHSPAAGLSTTQLQTATLRFDMGNGETEDLTIAGLGAPGEHADYSTKNRFNETRAQLIEEQVAAEMKADPEANAQSKRRLIEGMTSTNDVLRRIAKVQHFQTKAAAEAQTYIDRGVAPPGELSQILNNKYSNPLVREKLAGQHMVRSTFEATLNSALHGAVEAGTGPMGWQDLVENDDEAFMHFWPTFYGAFGKQFQKSYSSLFSQDEDEFRLEVIELLFPEADWRDQARLSARTRGLTAAEAELSVGTRPTPMQFSYSGDGDTVKK